MKNCPMCEMMKGRLASLNVDYNICMDSAEMLSKGIKHVPVIEDEEGKMYSGRDAMAYINNRFKKEVV